MPEATFELRALPAAEAVEKFFVAAGHLFPGVATQNLTIATNLHPEQYSLSARNADAFKSTGDALQVIEALKGQQQYVRVKRIYVVAMTAGPQQNDRRAIFEYNAEDGLTAILKLKIDNEDFFKQQIGSYAAKLNAVYTLTVRAALIGTMLPEVEQQKLKYREQATNDLFNALTKLEDAGIRQVEKQAEFFQKKSTELDEQQRQKMEEYRKEHESKLNQIAAERESLAKEKKEIDDRRATFARRALLTDMRTAINEKIEVTKPTAQLRWVIHALCGAAMLAGVILGSFGANRLLGEDKLDWHHWSVFIAGMVLFSTTLIFYLRWHNAWFRQLAQAELDTRKLKIDVLRASWLAEMLLEWVDEKGQTPFPPQVLSAFTSEMFRSVELPDDEYHPIGQLVNVIKGIDSLRINKDGLELSKKK